MTDSPTLKAILRVWEEADHGVRRSMACELAIGSLDATGKHGVEVLRHMLRMVLGRPDADLYRFAELVALGAEPYVMVYSRAARPDLCAFQRWSNKWAFRSIAWPDYARDGSWDTRITVEGRAESDAAWHRVVGRMLHAT